MKRREFLTGAAVAGVTASTVGTLAAPAYAQGKQEWKMVTTWPRNAPGVGVNAQRFADHVTAMSDGRLTVRLFSAGELVPPLECLDAVQNDTAQMAHSTPYYWVGKSPTLNFFSTIPFGLMAWELAGWVHFGGGQELWDEVYAPFGVKPFLAGNSGSQAGGWFKKPIESLDDIKGLKMRIAGLGGEAMRRLGAAVTLTPAGEIMPSLMSGAVDAAEWVSPWLDIAFGLQKAAKYYYMPAFHEPGPALEVIVNKERFENLDANLKAIVERAAQASAHESLADFTYHNIDIYERLKTDYPDVEVRTFNDEILAALAGATKEILAELRAHDDLAARVHDSYMGYNRKAQAYQQRADLAVMQMRHFLTDLG
jgi:TRAP-type mannitol/chloroaromatic compound transport system substrate-binding protein